MKQQKVYIYGKHALMEALKNSPQVLDRVFLAKEHGADKALMSALKRAGITVSALGSDKTSKGLAESTAHQGVVARVSLGKLVLPYDDFIKSLDVTENTSLLILGEIEDPHNVGAIIRSAAAFGVAGVLIPQHNQAPVTGTVVKVSAGMAFRIPLVEVGNINNVVRDLKERGFWIYGLDGEAEISATQEQFEKPSVFVLGNESKGIRQKTRELCDTLISIPMHPRCESLNVAASTAVMLYAWSSQHKEALNK